MPLIGVAPNGEVWQVTREGEILSMHESRDDALRAARDLACDEPSQIVVAQEQPDVDPVVIALNDADADDPQAVLDGDRNAGHPEPNEAR